MDLEEFSHATRTTVYINSGLLLLLKSENPPPNVSKLLNEALAAYLGVDYIHEPDIIKAKTERMRSKLIQKFADQKKLIDLEIENDRAEEEHEQHLKKMKLLSIEKVLKGGVHRHKLPEKDTHDVYFRWWETVAKKAASLAGFPITEADCQNYVREFPATILADETGNAYQQSKYEKKVDE